MNKVRLPDTCIRDETEHGKEYVLLADVRTYGDQRAAEAREQMREECVKEITQLTTIYTDKTAGFDLGYTKASNLAVKLIKGLK